MKIRPFAVLAFVTLAAAACGDAPSGVDRTPRDVAVSASDADEVMATRRRGENEPLVLRFRSVEDPAFPADRSVCAAAPFTTNVYLGASLWSEVTTISSGRVVHDAVRRIGKATACVRITDPTFPPGLPQDFYARFDTPEGIYTALGACTLISNDVPASGLVLGGCHLRIVSGPQRSRGGAITSLSVFNPAQLPGYMTGSEWTVQTY